MKRKRGSFAARCLAAVLSLLMPLTLGSCFDLGEFEGGNGDYRSYYESFGDVVALFDGGMHTYDVEKSLFSDRSVENMGWDNEEDAVASEEYVYLILPFEQEMAIESIALFLQTESEADFSISAFYYETPWAAPSRVRYKSSPETEIVKETDEHGNEVEKEVEIEYDDPAPDDSVAETYCTTKPQEWESFLLENFDQEGYRDGLLHTGQGGMLFIRFDNNSWLYFDAPSYPFRFINLLVRAV